MMPPEPSYAKGPTDTPLLEETIGRNLERTTARFGSREALVDRARGLRFTYAELDRAVDGIARALLAAGINKGDRVGLWSPNRAEWVLVQYATAKVGAVLVNVNPAYRTEELAHAIRQSGTRLVVSAPSFKTSDYRALLAAVRDACPTLERVVFFDDPTWEELLRAGDSVHASELEARQATLSPNDPINIQYTSGTTGAPKGATLTHRNILNNGYFVGALLGYTEAERVCIPVPFYHCFGMVMGNLACTSHGACMVIPAPAFEAEATLRAVAEERCTSLYGVPTMFIAELASPCRAELDLTSLRKGIMAGSLCPIELMRRVVGEMHLGAMSICYGMTETSPVSTQTRVDDTLEVRVTTVGRPGPHVEVKIVDPETGHLVPRGEKGELCTRGYSVMKGYWNQPEATREAIDDEGYMHTGDLATMDDEGNCTIVGRIKDMVIRGGENVYPREVEELLYRHPSISEVQIVGVPDPRYGEELCAWLRLVDGETLTEEDVRAYCRGKIAHYKVPRYVSFVTEFPMTVTGKIQKYKIREVAIRELGLEPPPG